MIDTRARVEYLICEFSTGWAGRGFSFIKLIAGTDKTEQTYSVFCSPANPDGDLCDCRGFVAQAHCKHVDAVRALLENRWI